LTGLAEAGSQNLLITLTFFDGGFGCLSNRHDIRSFFRRRPLLFMIRAGAIADFSLERIAASISLAISGCSFRKSLPFSGPGPFHIP
jgi:hypothetical protein